MCETSTRLFTGLRPFSPGVFPGSSGSRNTPGRHKTLDECERVSRFPTFSRPRGLSADSVPLSLSSPIIYTPRAIWRIFFFVGCHGAQVATPQRPSSPDEGGGEEKQGERGGPRAGCYICNIFAFTIFRLVCILEPALTRLHFALSILTPLSHSFHFSLYAPEPPLVDGALYVLSPPAGSLSSSARCNSFIPFTLLLRARARAAFPKTTRLGRSQRIPFSQIIQKTR